MNQDYTKDYSVKLSEADNRGKLKIQSFFDYMLDAAASHSTDVGMSAIDLLGQGKTWVVSRYNLKIEKYPLWNQKFSIKTWRGGEKGKYAIREFLFYNLDKEVIARASSAWLLLDLNTGDTLNPRDVFKDYPWKEERAIDDSFEALPLVVKTCFSKNFQIRLQDIDMNSHVNNSVYPSLAYETGFDFYESKKQLKSIEVFFKNAALYGNAIQSEIEEDRNDFLIHKLGDKETGGIHALLISTWFIDNKN